MEPRIHLADCGGDISALLKKSQTCTEPEMYMYTTAVAYVLVFSVKYGRNLFEKNINWPKKYLEVFLNYVTNVKAI